MSVPWAVRVYPRSELQHVRALALSGEAEPVLVLPLLEATRLAWLDQSEEPAPPCLLCDCVEANGANEPAAYVLIAPHECTDGAQFLRCAVCSDCAAKHASVRDAIAAKARAEGWGVMPPPLPAGRT